MNFQSIKNIILVLILAITHFNCQNQLQIPGDTISLSGLWRFSLDPDDIGIQQQWYLSELSDVIHLPGTTDLSHKGYLNQNTTTLHLNRLYIYEGPAWYRKKITIPEKFLGRHIQLFMERTKSSMIWIDEYYIGESHLLQSPQCFDVSKYLSPGEHSITIRINNDLKLTPYGNVHIYTDETQTNWNGIIGDFYLEAMPQTYIADIQVFSDVDNRKINIKLAIVNGLGFETIDVELQAVRMFNSKKKKLAKIRKTLPCDSILHLEYKLGDEMELWDDYQQPLYTLTAAISNNKVQHTRSAPFGMRKFEAVGTQFAVNGRTTFLRGKHDACVFPLTGHPPMAIDGWLYVFKTARSYGINHYRFHSYCPPEAAFQAADRLGFFLQPELPFWGSLESDRVAVMLKNEGLAMLKSYANHPSFVMFCPGNEIWGGHDRIEKIITDLKEKDTRPLYTMGANNNIGYFGPCACSDFHIAVRTPSAEDTILTHTRLTHAFVDSQDGGILNTQSPSTTVNFDYPVSQIKIPLVSHEIGQYQIYPDYQEIKKYIGVVNARNLEIFRDRLQKSGMLDQNMDFQKASGAWAALCYKAEMEAALRTAGLAGFQLLDLQDYPGQGTALVGILDAFMDSKNVIRREKWLQSCNDVVILALFSKYCWQTNENFQAQLQVANYSNESITDEYTWEIVDQEGQIFKTETFSELSIDKGKLVNIGKINVALHSIEKPEKLTINLTLKKSGYTNAYPIWVYPTPERKISHDEHIITEQIDKKKISQLQKGRKVLLFPTFNSIQDKSLAGLFPPDFWNYGMFKGISERAKKPVSPGTLGILTDPAHPLFNSFPTDFHTNWQWYSIIKASRPLILNQTPHQYRPVVQIIDNLERNNKLGLIFEFVVGKGKLLVCMARLKNILDKPEAYYLYKSIINYMNSNEFAPAYSADEKLLENLLTSPEEAYPQKN